MTALSMLLLSLNWSPLSSGQTLIQPATPSTPATPGSTSSTGISADCGGVLSLLGQSQLFVPRQSLVMAKVSPFLSYVL